MRCPSTAVSVIIILLLILFVLGALAFLIYTSMKATERNPLPVLVKILINYLQVMSLLGGVVAGMPALVLTVIGYERSASSADPSAFSSVSCIFGENFHGMWIFVVVAPWLLNIGAVVVLRALNKRAQRKALEALQEAAQNPFAPFSTREEYEARREEIGIEDDIAFKRPLPKAAILRRQQLIAVHEELKRCTAAAAALQKLPQTRRRQEAIAFLYRRRSQLLLDLEALEDTMWKHGEWNGGEGESEARPFVLDGEFLSPELQQSDSALQREDHSPPRTCADLSTKLSNSRDDSFNPLLPPSSFMGEVEEDEAEGEASTPDFLSTKRSFSDTRRAGDVVAQALQSGTLGTLNEKGVRNCIAHIQTHQLATSGEELRTVAALSCGANSESDSDSEHDDKLLPGVRTDEEGFGAFPPNVLVGDVHDAISTPLVLPAAAEDNNEWGGVPSSGRADDPCEALDNYPPPVDFEQAIEEAPLEQPHPPEKREEDDEASRLQLSSTQLAFEGFQAPADMLSFNGVTEQAVAIPLSIEVAVISPGEGSIAPVGFSRNEIDAARLAMEESAFRFDNIRDEFALPVSGEDAAHIIPVQGLDERLAKTERPAGEIDVTQDDSDKEEAGEQNADAAPVAEVTPLGRQVLLASVVIFLMLYPMVIERCLLMFKCDAVNYGPPSPSYEAGGVRNLLFSDRAIDCDSTAHQRYKLAALSLGLAYGIGVPVSITSLIRFLQAKKGLATALQMFAFYTAGYDTTHWWWEGVILTRKFCLIAISVFIINDDLRLYVAMWFLSFALLGHVQAHAFLSEMLHNVETLSLSTIIVTLNLALLFEFTRDSTAAFLALALTIIALNVATISIILFLITRELKAMFGRVFTRLKERFAGALQRFWDNLFFVRWWRNCHRDSKDKEAELEAAPSASVVVTAAQQDLPKPSTAHIGVAEQGAHARCRLSIVVHGRHKQPTADERQSDDGTESEPPADEWRPPADIEEVWSSLSNNDGAAFVDIISGDVDFLHKVAEAEILHIAQRLERIEKEKEEQRHAERNAERRKSALVQAGGLQRASCGMGNNIDSLHAQATPPSPTGNVPGEDRANNASVSGAPLPRGLRSALRKKSSY